jgi:hypothetical protein
MPLPRPLIATMTATGTLVLARLSGCSTLPDAGALDRAARHPDGLPGTTKVAGHRGLVRTGRGWSTAGIHGPVPAPGSCHYRHTDDEVLPDPHCTPGAVDTADPEPSGRS